MHSTFMMNINQAINYIYNNLDKNLTVEEIAEHCCFSKYYFNRIFKTIVGESMYSFIKRMRMEKAAFMLKTESKRTITDIAADVGYSSSNFASAFRQCYGVSASDFKKLKYAPGKDSFADVVKYIQSIKKDENVYRKIDAKIKIKNMAAMNLMYRRVICNYARDLEEAWGAFCKEIESKGQLDPHSRFIGISYDDPLLAHEDRCVYDMCIETDKCSGVDIHRLPPGTYACYEFHDRKDKLILAFNELSSLWLPFCKYELADRPVLEIYQSGIDERGNLHAEICLPIKNCSF